MAEPSPPLDLFEIVSSLIGRLFVEMGAVSAATVDISNLIIISIVRDLDLSQLCTGALLDSLNEL